MLTISGRRALNRSLQSLIKHNESTVTVLEQLVEDLHEHPLLVPYQMINHERFEDLVWGIIKIMDSKNLHSPSVAGNAAYVIGAIIDTDVGKNRVFRLFADPSKLESHKYVLPNLTAIIECDDKKASVNASGTIAVIVGTEAGRTWALKQPSFDWVLHVLSKSVTSDNAVSASNCSLAIARICVVEEGCSRILNFRNARFILTQLIKSLGVDKEGVGMNSAFALAHLCQHETGLRLLLSLDESPEMVSSLVTMLCSSDEGCSKNACFALRNMATNTLGQKMLINCPDIDRILQTLSMLLMSRDEEIAKFAAVGLRYLASEKDGYLQQKAHPMVKPNLRRVLSNPGISHAYRKEAIKTLQNLLLPTPEKPVLQVLGAHAIKASWEDIAAKSGLDVNYGLYVDDEIVYEGPQTSFVVSGLEEVTEYVFKLRAWTDEDEESGVSETVKATTFRAVSRAPRGLRAVSITASQIKFIWSPPERVYGMLNGYKVREIGRDITYEPVSTYHIAGNLKPDTEYTFEVSAVTKRGEGESAKLTVRTLRHDSYAPSKPDLVTIGPHEILATWQPPDAPIGRINGYEVLVDDKRVYFGLDKRCLVQLLKPDTIYEFKVVAWTNEGKCTSEPACKKTAHKDIAKSPRRKPWKTKDELVEWLENHENPLSTSRSTKSSMNSSRVSSGEKSSRRSNSTNKSKPESNRPTPRTDRSQRNSEKSEKNNNNYSNRKDNRKESNLSSSLSKPKSPRRQVAHGP